MPEDRLQELFEQVTRIAVEVPPADGVLARGRQRRRRARLQVSAIAWTILIAAGFGAPQGAADLVGSPKQFGSAPPVANGPYTGSIEPQAAHPSSTAITQFGSMNTTLRSGPSVSPTPSSVPTASPRVSPAHPKGSGSMPALTLPPPGKGQLLLGLDTSHHFVMTRVGSASPPVRLPGLAALADAPPVLVTNPGGGWVVMVSANQGAPKVIQSAQLALVTVAGWSERFGPVFRHVTVTSAAVSPAGSRVAVALTGQSGRASIAVLPLPGHLGAGQTWRLPLTRANLVTSLSWAPDGRHLSYIAGQQNEAGVAGAPVTLDTAIRSSSAPVAPAWPAVTMAGTACVPDVTAWLGRSGRFAALEECPGSGTEVLQQTDPTARTAAGRPLVVARHIGCRPAALDPAAKGDRLLISYCGIYIDDHGKLTKAPGSLTAAALGG
ncbi:MAG TPA: hypothetical protein VMU94_08285 [Streptosporangiaceae bacterium]|nr:hypothetical protein [Streptosporangiaceae bacterium]